MNANALDTHQKALQLNLDAGFYGSFVETGAGQEVARWFSRVGGSGGTIARAFGALGPLADQEAVDSGPTAGRERLEATLVREYQHLSELLDSRRGGDTSFFVFASVFPARDGRLPEEPRGWIGIRFQTRPRSRPSQIVLQIRIQDSEPAGQQDALGALGVNLVYGARHFADCADTLLASLLDNLASSRVAIDVVDFSGPAFAGADNRLLNRKPGGDGLPPAAPEAPRGAKPSDRSAARRGRKPLCGGLMDSVHLAGMPKAA